MQQTAAKWILITGGAGFIGSNLCEYFLKKGNNVVCIDNMSTGKYMNVRDFNNKYKGCFMFSKTSVCDKALIEKYYMNNLNITHIYHLACPASPKMYQQNPLRTIDTCVNGTIAMLEIARKYKMPILIASTSEIYGDPEISPQNENYKGCVNTFGPRACYDVSKRMTETLAYEYIKLGVCVKIARIFNTYGPNMHIDDGRVITNFIKQSLYNNCITIYGDGKQTRSFCYISDTVDGLVLLMDTEYKGPVNIGFPVEHTINEIADLIMEMTGKYVYKRHTKLPQDDPSKRSPDISLMTKLTGWTPKVSIKEGLKKTINYLKNQNNNNILGEITKLNIF